MNKIYVIPHEGFTVRDHEGNVIPKDGAEVVESRVVLSRIREGLLIVIEEDEEPLDHEKGDEGGKAPAETSPGKEGASTEEAPEDAEEYVDEDVDADVDQNDVEDAADGGSIEPSKMSRKELMALLTEYGIQFKANANHKVLVGLVFKHLREDE